MTKIKIILNWLKNIKVIYNLREFFVFYLSKFSEFKKLPADKKYLLSNYGFVGSYCSRLFVDHAPVFMESEIKNIAEKVFDDEDSRKLYYLFFLRQMHCAYFVDGWEKYYDDERTFEEKLRKIKSAIASNVIFVGNLFFTKTKKKKKFILNFTNGATYILPINWFEISVFCMKLGLPYLKAEYLSYIKRGNVIDAGAFVGDSSIVLAEYTDEKVFAIEAHAENFKLLEKTVALNNLQTKIIALNAALDREVRRVNIISSGAGARTAVADGQFCTVSTVTLDKLFENKSQKISLIKLDVEGFEMNILLGADQVIRRDKPVLFVSIYHSGEQFINVPLQLKEKYSDIYSFKFIDCNPVHPLAEKVLLCLPKDV
ncbi:MAG: FkbM family methyltransferase [Candidatus Falkowbacteria bacterium]